MAHKFEEILDDCLDRVTLQGESIESCLARYPEHATELEPYLRTATRVTQAYASVPTIAKKELARQRLHAEMRTLRQKAPAKRHSGTIWGWWDFGWLARRATLAAIAASLLVMLSGVSTVAFASDAIPGDALYTMKRKTEQVLLAIPLPPAEKAKLSLNYADRRATEMVALAKEGKPSEVLQLQNDLRQELNNATSIVANVQDGQKMVEVKAQLLASASQVLSKLQSGLDEAPSDSHQAISDTFQASSQTFGAAIETIMSKVPEPVIAAAVPGILQFMATDPPPPSVEQVLVTVSQIEVFLPAGDKSRWITITQQPQTFDLLQVAGIQKFLGQSQVEPRTYTKVRFLITSAKVVAGGQEYPAKVPSDRMSLLRPFVVEAGKTTLVLLDFDGARSLSVTGQNEYIIKPVVNVLIQRAAEQKQEDRQTQKTGRESTKRDTERRTEKVRQAQFEGIIEAVAPNYIVVQGARIAIASSTRIEGKLETGRKAEVEAILQPDGNFLAVKVEIKQPSKDGEKTPAGKAAKISGIVESISGNEWIVDGQKVKLDRETDIRTQARVGEAATVEGQIQADGSIIAREIKPKEKETTTGKQADDKETASRSILRLSGIVQKYSPTELTVNGRTISITPDTKVEGSLSMGLTVEIEAKQQPDGKVLAVFIKVSGKADERGRDAGKDQGNTPTPKPPEKSGQEKESKSNTGTPKPPEKSGQEKESNGKATVSFTGTVEKAGASELTVDGKVVIIGPGTKLEGTPAKGVRVRIEGQQQPDGKILASLVRVIDRSEETRKGDTRTTRPTEGRD